MSFSALLLSTADWDRPVWTNKQHMALRLAAGGRVIYVNSLGLRRPSARPDDLLRVARRVLRPGRGRGAGPAAAPRPPGLRVVDPLVLPYHRLRHPVWDLNRRLLEHAVRAWLEGPPGERILWTYSPVTYGLERHAAATVYHCVDLLAGFPRVDATAIAEGEARLARAGATALASSRTIERHLRASGFAHVELWENVADSRLVEEESRGEEREPSTAAFVGNLSPYKVDFALLRRLVEDLPRLRLELAGPEAEGGGGAPELAWFRGHPRVTVRPTLAPAEMARLLGRASVGLVPYLLNDYTSGVFPMKVYEYLAAGLPVVTTALPSLEGADEVTWCKDAGAFLRQVGAELGLPHPADVERRRALARSRSWDARGAQALFLVERLLAKAPEPLAARAPR
jgi:glycosyltransferase involved in cell wall biosynthesis